jgi:hypothetical protein
MTGDGTVRIEKISGFVTASQEMVDEAERMAPVFARLFGPDTRTAEEKERDRLALAARQAQWRAEQVQIKAEHAARLLLADGAVRDLLELHTPVFWDGDDGTGHCDGCDAEGYECEAPGFPCRTYDILAASLEQS